MLAISPHLRQEIIRVSDDDAMSRKIYKTDVKFTVDHLLRHKTAIPKLVYEPITWESVDQHVNEGSRGASVRVVSAEFSKRTKQFSIALVSDVSTRDPIDSLVKESFVAACIDGICSLKIKNFQIKNHVQNVSQNGPKFSTDHIVSVAKTTAKKPVTGWSFDIKSSPSDIDEVFVQTFGRYTVRTLTGYDSELQEWVFVIDIASARTTSVKCYLTCKKSSLEVTATILMGMLVLLSQKLPQMHIEDTPGEDELGMNRIARSEARANIFAEIENNRA